MNMYDFPDDLLQAQQQLQATQRELTALYAAP
jgi:hypothetical protein